MSDKKEIRFVIDAAIPANRQLLEALGQYRAHERNKLILDVLISHFTGIKVRDNEPHRTIQPDNRVVTEIEQLKKRIDKIEAFLFNSVSGELVQNESEKENMQHVQQLQVEKPANMTQEEKHEDKTVENVDAKQAQSSGIMTQNLSDFILQPGIAQDEAFEEDIAAEIPDDVMNMIMSLQSSQ